MKKLQLLLYLSLIITLKTFAQNLNSVQRFIAANDYLSAKKQVDSLLSVPASRQLAAPWFYKAKIYVEVARRHDSTHSGLLKQALESYKRYQELDPENTLMGLDNNVGLFQLYDLSYNKAVLYYNQEEYGLAFLNFKNALETEEYIYKKKFSFNGKQFPALDTQLVSLTAFSAYLSKNEEAAIPYFEKLAELQLAGAEFKGVYTLLYQYHVRKNDPAKAARYLNTGRKIFDDETHWIKLELGNPKTEKERLARYESLLKKYPGNFSLNKLYAIDLFNYVYEGEQQPEHDERNQDKLDHLLNKLIQLDTGSALSYYMMSQHLLNQVYELEEMFHGMDESNPAAETKKQSVQNKILSKNDQLILHAEKAWQLYASSPQNPEDKARCRQLLDNLVKAYQKKKDREKERFYEDLKKEY